MVRSVRVSPPLWRLRVSADRVAVGLLVGAAGAAALWGVLHGLAWFVYREKDDAVMVLWIFMAAALGFLVFQLGARVVVAVLFAFLVAAVPMMRLHVMRQQIFHDRGRVERAVVVAETEERGMDGASFIYELRVPDGLSAGPLYTGDRRLSVGSTVTVTVDPEHEVATVLGRRSGAPAASRALEEAAEALAGLIVLWLGVTWAMGRARTQEEGG